MTEIIRSATFADIDTISKFLEGHRVGDRGGRTGFNPSSGDIAAVSEDSQSIRGVLVARPVMLLHEFQLRNGTGDDPSTTARRLFDYGSGVLRALDRRECLMLVYEENTRMHAFLRNSVGAVRQPDSAIYTLTTR